MSETINESQEPRTEDSQVIGQKAVESVQQTDEGRVDDVAKAWDIAHAAKGKRDYAADLRRASSDATTAIETIDAPAEVIEDAQRQIAELDHAMRKQDDELYAVVHDNEQSTESRDKAKEQQQQLYAENYEAKLPHKKLVDELLKDENPELRRALSTLVYKLKEDLRDDPTGDISKLRDDTKDIFLGHSERFLRESSENDDAAERLEYWTGILHDNPPSDAYKQRFGIESVTPSELYRLERDVNRAKQEAENTRKNIDRYASSAHFYGTILRNTLVEYGFLSSNFHDRDAEEYVGQTIYVPRSEEAQDYLKTLSMPNDSQDRSDILAQAAHKFIDKVDLPSKLKQTFLEDIQTGRAAQWQ